MHTGTILHKTKVPACCRFFGYEKKKCCIIIFGENDLVVEFKFFRISSSIFVDEMRARREDNIIPLLIPIKLRTYLTDISSLYTACWVIRKKETATFVMAWWQGRTVSYWFGIPLEWKKKKSCLRIFVACITIMYSNFHLAYTCNVF